MPDPLEQLRAPVEPVEPRASFRRNLRRQIRAALGEPADIRIEPLTRSRAMTTISPDPAPSTSPGTSDPGAAGQRATLDGMWAALHYRDAPGAIRFAIDVLGFQELIVVRDEADPAVVHHSELRWPEGGIVQIATADRPGNMYSRQAGLGTLYVITRDPESVLARCEAAGAAIVDPLREVDYGVPGDRMFTVRDAEGTLWCFGSYGADR